MVYQSGSSTRRSHPCHHDNGEGDLEAEIYDPERIRLMIQIIVFIESGAISITDDVRKDIENFARIIVGMGPQSTLQRGFAIARDNDDKP